MAKLKNIKDARKLAKTTCMGAGGYVAEIGRTLYCGMEENTDALHPTNHFARRIGTACCVVGACVYDTGDASAWLLSPVRRSMA